MTTPPVVPRTSSHRASARAAAFRTLVAIAARDLVRQRRRALAGAAILVVGVAIVLLTRGWQRGMLDLLSQEGAAVWLGGVQVHPKDTLARRDAFALTPNVDLALPLGIEGQGAAHVHAVAPRIRFLARVYGARDDDAARNHNADGARESATDTGAPAFVLATDLRSGPLVLPRLFSPDRLQAGRFPSSDDEVLVAAPLAAALGLRAGDTATLLARPVDGGLEGADVRVVGILRAAFEENQKRAIVASLPLAQRLLRMEGRATEVLLGIEPLDRADQIAAGLSQHYAASPSTAHLQASAWTDINPRYVAARKIWATSLGVILVVVLIVASLGISTSLTLIVHERAREVATMTALGLPRRALLAMFLCEGALLGAVGGAGGCALGGAVVALLHARGVSFFPPGGFLVQVHPHVTAGDLGVALAVCALGSALVMAMPAFRAARRNPAELLR